MTWPYKGSFGKTTELSTGIPTGFPAVHRSRRFRAVGPCGPPAEAIRSSRGGSDRPATATAETADATRGTAVSAIDIQIKLLDSGLPPPAYAHSGDAGADLHCAEDLELLPGERATVRTGVAIALPEGFAAFIHPRSGLAAKAGVTLVNAPGTVDAGYRGELKVTLINTDLKEAVRFHRGDRIAQLIIQRVERAVFHEVTELPDSARGAGGHGSTGGHAATADRSGGE